MIDLTTLMAKLPAFALANAKWYCSSYCFATTMLRLAASAGGATVAELSGGMRRQFLGHDVVISQKLPTGAASLDAKVMLLFGDLRLSSTLGSQREIRVMISDDRYFEYDQVGIKATERFDIVNHDIEDTSTAGPVVALIGNVA